MILSLLFAVPAALHGQGISSAVVTVPELILISGQQMQVEAVSRDNSGNLRNDRFGFRSSNASVLTIDASSGVATAINPGIAGISATVQGTNFTTPTVLVQVTPLRIDIAGSTSDINVGDSRQFTASAVDINEQPLANVSFRWQLTGANGFNTRAASIDNNGMLRTNGIGVMTIHAQIVYAGQSSAHTPIFEGLTQVRISVRKEFKLTRQLASSTLERTFPMRPAYNADPGMNDSGQAAFIANLDGLGSALMLYENGKYEMLASAGTPGPLGGYIWNFDGPPAINNRGDVLVRVGTSNGWGLLRASKSGLNFILENGIGEGFARMNFFRLGRSSLNDRGDMVFVADFQWVGTPVWYTGIFLMNDQTFRMIWSNADALPSIPAGFGFDNSMFGVDQDGAAYFRVVSGRNSAIFRADGLSDPVKIAGTGSSVAGLQIQDVSNLALSSNGTVAFNVRDAGNSLGVVRRLPGKSLDFLSLRFSGGVLSVNDYGDVLYVGDPGSDPWWGVYVWKGSAEYATRYTQLFRLSAGVALEGGEKPVWARTGTVTRSGEIYASFDSPENHLLVARIDSSPRTLWKGGTGLNLKANLNFQGILPGGVAGAVHVFGGSANASVLEVTPTGTRTIWAPGDQTVAGVSSMTLSQAAKSPAGDVHLTFSDGIVRFVNGKAETIIRFPIEDRDRITVRNPNGWHDGNNSFSVNSSGVFVFNSRTDNDNRLELYNRGVLIPIMIQGGSNQTASPSGGRFSGISGGSMRQNSVQIDERNRVLVNAQVSGGPSGLFIYDNGQWRSAALFRQTSINNAIVTGSRVIRVAGNNFYSLLDMANGDSMIARYDGQSWTPLVRRYDIMPDGTELGFLYNGFAVNRGGDIVYASNANGEKIILRTADGVNHLVYSELTPTDDGDLYPNQTFEFDIRDDGRIYFVGFDLTDRNTVYLAERIR
jgi:hypothetical protein